MELTAEIRPSLARLGRRTWSAMPGSGPAPRLRRRVIAVVPGLSTATRLRWQAGTVLPRVGPTDWIRRHTRAAVVGAAGLAGAAGAVTVAKRRANGSPST